MSAFTLNDLRVQAQTTGTWQTLRGEQFRSTQQAGQTITDPISGRSDGIAGALLLTQVLASSSDGTTLPSLPFGYTPSWQKSERFCR